MNYFSEFISNNKLLESCYQTRVNTFSEFISNITGTLRELLPNNTTHFSGVYIKQYLHFQRVPSKLNYRKKFFQSSHHMILTLLESYYQSILTYLELISHSTHTFTESLLNSSKHFFESFNGHLNRQKILKEKIPQ